MHYYSWPRGVDGGPAQHTAFLTHPVLLVDPRRRVPPVCNEGMASLSNNFGVEEGGELGVGWRQVIDGEVAADEAVLQIDKLAQRQGVSGKGVGARRGSGREERAGRETWPK
jgi:hypothetical protein